jgi:hypothetical protein
MMRALSVLALAMFAFATPVLADDDNDIDDDRELGAYVYEGTVESYGDRPVEEVGELESIQDDDDDDIDDVWGVIGGGEPVPNPLWGEDDEDIDLTIEQLTAAPHVLVVHAGESPSTPVVAIGAIEAELNEEGTLLIDLDEVDNSGFEGRAHFAPDLDDDDDDGDDDRDETDVTVGIWQVQAAGV